MSTTAGNFLGKTWRWLHMFTHITVTWTVTEKLASHFKYSRHLTLDLMLSGPLSFIPHENVHMYLLHMRRMHKTCSYGHILTAEDVPQVNFSIFRSQLYAH